jgi:putative heme iron utilization protein
MSDDTAPQAEEEKRAMAFAARQLLRAAPSATLATQQGGQPFASLVTPATAPDLTILLWLSTLSEHTRQLAREPRCALLVQGDAAGANPQTAPRLTITGLASSIADEALKARWLARHPYAALYAGFADFALWRITPAGALWVGGFARARRFRMAEFLPDAAHVARIAAAEAEIIGHMNTDHPEAVARMAATIGGEAGPWRMTGVDVDGCDLALGEQVLRQGFERPAREPEDVRRELIRLARAARSA